MNCSLKDFIKVIENIKSDKNHYFITHLLMIRRIEKY